MIKCRTCDQSEGGEASEGVQVDVHRVQWLGELDDGAVPHAEAAAALRSVQHHAVVKHQSTGAGDALFFRRSSAPASQIIDIHYLPHPQEQ